MGCCLQTRVSNFAKVENKQDLLLMYNNEVNRVKLLRTELVAQPTKQEDINKREIVEKILHEDNWLLLMIIDKCSEEHIIKLKFLLLDYFMVTESWNKNAFEENLGKIKLFYKENKSIDNLNESIDSQSQEE